jgi:hypothetical protein
VFLRRAVAAASSALLPRCRRRAVRLRHAAAAASALLPRWRRRAVRPVKNPLKNQEVNPPECLCGDEKLFFDLRRIALGKSKVCPVFFLSRQNVKCWFLL